MTTAGNFRAAVVRTAAEVSVAGVPWPVYKLVALAIGALVFIVVGVATMSLGPAVLSAAAAGTVTGLALRLFSSDDA
jgi:uncharacterized membrane protein